MRKSALIGALCLAALGSVPGCARLRAWSGADAPVVVAPPQRAQAQVVGRVATPGRRADLGHTVVFLEPIDAPRATETAPQPIVIRQRLTRFQPDFAVATVGQPVRFENDDKIFHGVFSVSRPNQFEQRPFPPGQSRTVTLKHPGTVVIYSPLHTDMRGVILVAPSAYHVLPNAHGVFQLGGVPAGRYRLSLWTERHGEVSREITLAAGEIARADLTLGAKK